MTPRLPGSEKKDFLLTQGQRVVDMLFFCQLTDFCCPILLLFLSQRLSQSGQRVSLVPLQMHSHSLENFCVLGVGAVLDKTEADSLVRWQSHGMGLLDGFQAEFCLPSSHPVMSHGAQPTALPRAASRLLFAFILLCAGHVRLRVLIDRGLGLLSLVVGQGDKWKFWPVPLCHFLLLS